MNVASYLTVSNTAGLFELTKDGQVLYSRFRQNKELINADSDLIGHNFFDEVAGFENAAELRRIFNNFVKSNQFTDNFVFECHFAEQVVPSGS